MQLSNYTRLLKRRFFKIFTHLTKCQLRRGQAHVACN